MNNNLTIKDMCEYGYTYEKMIPLNEDKAIQLFEAKFINTRCPEMLFKSISIYRLYPDNTEGVVESLEDLEHHAMCGGIFGIEYEDTHGIDISITI